MKPRRVRIFMMGDSITEGDGNGSAYRYALFEKLCKAGAVFEFLGPNTSGDIRLPEKYWHHGGYCGYVIGEDETSEHSLRLMMARSDYRAAAAQADMILLWIGFNDINQKIDIEHMGDRLDRLLDEIYSVNPDVTVYVATLFEQDFGRQDYNSFLLNYDTALSQAKGRKVRIVDMNQPELRISRTASPADFPPDDAHPNEFGNRKIAEMWVRAICEDVLAMNRQGDPDYAEPVRVEAISADLRDVDLRSGEGHTFKAAVVPQNAEITTILWRSSAPDVASVDDYGTVRAHKAGSALISAVTLDGGFRAVARMNVADEVLDPGEGMETVLEEHFASKDDWEGTVSIVKPEFSKLGWRWDEPAEGTLRLKKDIPAGEKMLLTFDYATANDRTRSSERRLSICLGGVEVRISAGGIYSELYENGVLKGSAQTLPKVAVVENYALYRDGRTAVLYKNNEKLFSCKTSEAPVKTDLTIEWAKFNHKNYIWNLTVKKG